MVSAGHRRAGVLGKPLTVATSFGGNYSMDANLTTPVGGTIIEPVDGLFAFLFIRGAPDAY